MKYEQVEKAVFLSRPNRFIAKVSLHGKEETVHVKNTGRCKELLTNGSVVYLKKSDNPARKTAYDLVAVEKKRDGDTLLINMDSALPNAVAAEWLPTSGLFSPMASIKREVTFGKSRFDLYIEDGERHAFIEVKGVTLEKDGVAYFPDAPTERGVKHLYELAEAVKQGYEG
ncbi:MAG: DNA/RNA nuclease SfsA, partial [Clostridia bacterium]|nr:DNA/RNA nuclease SfsA [Clostridia bacterium]